MGEPARPGANQATGPPGINGHRRKGPRGAAPLYRGPRWRDEARRGRAVSAHWIRSFRSLPVHFVITFLRWVPLMGPRLAAHPRRCSFFFSFLLSSPSSLSGLWEGVPAGLPGYYLVTTWLLPSRSLCSGRPLFELYIAPGGPAALARYALILVTRKCVISTN